MKILKKRTVTEVEGVATVKQTAWQPMANALVQCEFEVEYLVHDIGLTSVFGSMGIFLGKQIDRIRFMLCPRNASQPGAPAYDQMDLNYLEFVGEFLGSDPLGFRNSLAVKPTFDKDGGWSFEFAEATDGFNAAPSVTDVQVTAEMIASNCVCTGSFEVRIGRRYLVPTFARLGGGQHKLPAAAEILAPVILRDIEGLRQAVSDIAGEAYLDRLLRMHGYEIDRGGATP